MVLLGHRICKLFGVQLFYHSIYGVKVLNRKADKCILEKEGTVRLAPSNVLFFFDGLKDDYSLTGTSVIESPHYYLVKGILETDFSFCRDYCNRESLGALDGRFALRVNDATFDAHINCTRKNKKMLEKGVYKHPTVCLFNNDYYALDGKHRLAMAAYLEKEIDCDVLSLNGILCSDYIRNLLKKMHESPERYSKNLELLSAMKTYFSSEIKTI